MSQITIYPRLYTTRRANGEGVLVSKGDATVETLYEFHVNRTINTTAWPYRKQVLETALSLFGNFEQWLKDQYNNSRVSGHNEEFLKDTLQFIRTGRRDLCLESWIELVAEGNDLGHAAELTRVSPSDLILKRGETTILLLQNWCSQPKGLEDLVGTLHILFGRSRSQ